MREEAFIEYRHPAEGGNLRHFGPRLPHRTGPGCACSPERVPHADED